MLHPSYTDLMKVVNKDVEEGDSKVVNSRYSIVMATSKRARQLIAGELPLVPVKDGQKPLSIAIEELNEGELKILPEDTDEEQNQNSNGADAENAICSFDVVVERFVHAWNVWNDAQKVRFIYIFQRG